MAKDPSFVRLHERHAYGIIADITVYGTLWSISGNAIKAMPDPEEEADEYSFVKDLLRSGHLEPASRAEWDEQEENAQHLREAFYGGEFNRQASDMAVIQEHKVEELVRTRQRQIRRARGKEYDEDAERALTEAENQPLGDDDEDGDNETGNNAGSDKPPNTPAGRKAAAGKAAARTGT